MALTQSALLPVLCNMSLYIKHFAWLQTMKTWTSKWSYSAVVSRDKTNTCTLGPVNVPQGTGCRSHNALQHVYHETCQSGTECTLIHKQSKSPVLWRCWPGVRKVCKNVKIAIQQSLTISSFKLLEDPTLTLEQHRFHFLAHLQKISLALFSLCTTDLSINCTTGLSNISLGMQKNQARSRFHKLSLAKCHSRFCLSPVSTSQVDGPS